MKVTTKNGVLKFSCKLKKSQTFKIFENKKYKAVYVFNRPQTVRGFTNATEDNMSITFIDWDNTDYEVVKDDIKLIGQKFKLPPFYVFQTKKNNFHAVNLKKFPNGIIPQILLHTRCDSNYTFSPSLHVYRNYVLRLSSKKGSKKPRFKEMVGEMKNLNYEISKAHLDLLHNIYPKIPKINYSKLDEGKIIKTQIYQTSIE